MQTPTIQEPELFCINCRTKLDVVWMDSPLYLKATGREPHWAPLPCPVCQTELEKRRQQEERMRLRQKRLNDLLTNSMLRKRFISKTFVNFEIYGNPEAISNQTQALTIARDFADNFEKHREQGTWLLMMGKPGTGKTHLCAAIINQVVRKGYTALFTKTFRLLREIKDTYNRDAAVCEKEVLSRLQSLDLLVIDEIGVQFGTDTERMILFEVLDSRYEDMMPTIVTTNIPTIADLEALLGPRIVDRFFEGESRLVLFDWGSYRRSRHKQSRISTERGSDRPRFLRAVRREG